MTGDAPQKENRSAASSDETAELSVERGCFHAYFVYDVAETIDLTKVRNLESKGYESAQLELRAVGSPSYIQFAAPPAVAVLPDVMLDGRKAQARVKLYDYGTISIRLSVGYCGDWAGFGQISQEMRQNQGLISCAERLLAGVLEQVDSALNSRHEPLVEDYFVAEVESFHAPVSAEELLAKHRCAIASLLLGEVRPLTCLEQEEALRHTFSYFASDLAVVHWDGAFVFDSREGAESVESILEFANTQLVELRTYDAWLDAELDSIYKWDLARTRPHWLLGRRAAEKQADRLRCLLVDIRELSDRANNALKIIGDAYYARIYRGVALRLGLADWQEQIESKLGTIGEIYRFATDRAQYAWSEFLEVIIILLIALELVLSLMRSGK